MLLDVRSTMFNICWMIEYRRQMIDRDTLNRRALPLTSLETNDQPPAV